MKSFHDLSLSPLLLRAITEAGYETPSPIQAEALPILLGEPTDFLGLAATGTGKTAAFALPLLEKLDPKLRHVQAVVLCPTRELAIQVAGQISALGKYKNIRALPVYGGASMFEQINELRNSHPSVVVATPGRLVDHLQRGTIQLKDMATLILDEADEMISMGFKEDLETILSSAPRESCRIWLFSATMSREVRRVADAYLREPRQVQVNRTEMLSSTVEQIFYATKESYKPEVLCKLIDAADGFYGLVFCQTKALVSDLTQYLLDRGYRVDCLHGDKDQKSRERTIEAFRERKVQLLVCTDVAARGLDVKDVTHVINYSIPRELDNYVHRIGRTARSGKTGFALNLVTPSHRGLIDRIEQVTKSKMREGKVPTRKEIGTLKVSRLLNSFQDQEKTFGRASELLDESWKTAIAEMSREEIVGRFLSLNFPEIFGDDPQRPASSALGIAKPTTAPQETANRPSARKPSSERRQDGFERRAPRHAAPERQRGYDAAGQNRPSRPDAPERRRSYDAVAGQSRSVRPDAPERRKFPSPSTYERRFPESAAAGRRPGGNSAPERRQPTSWGRRPEGTRPARRPEGVH